MLFPFLSRLWSFDKYYFSYKFNIGFRYFSSETLINILFHVERVKELRRQLIKWNSVFMLVPFPCNYTFLFICLFLVSEMNKI